MARNKGILTLNEVYFVFSVIPFSCNLSQEKRDEEITKLIRWRTVNSRNNKDITKKRSEIPPVPTKDVIPPAESDDEDNQRDLNFRRRLFLKTATEESCK